MTSSIQSTKWAVGLVGVAVIVALAAPADAGPALTGRDYVPSEAELESIALAAQDSGMSMEDAIDYYAWEVPFVDFVNEISDKYPDSYAGAAIVRTEKFDAFVQFMGTIPDGLESDPRLAGLAVDFRANLGFSEKELNEKGIALHTALREMGWTELTTGYDVETGQIEIEAVPRERDADRSYDEMLALMPAEVRNDDVTVRFVYNWAEDDATLYGGGRLERSGSNSLHCTGGFKVKRNGVYGFATAGHCTDDGALTHENLSGFTEYSTTIKATYQGYWGDFGWYSTYQTHSDDFYTDFGALKDLSAIGTPVLGQTLCRFGQNTGAECDTVYKLNQSSNGSSHLVAMHHREAAGGDSGGPWWWGTKGYGIHKGAKKIWWVTRDLFSELHYVDDALGVTVQTS